MVVEYVLVRVAADDLYQLSFVLGSGDVASAWRRPKTSARSPSPPPYAPPQERRSPTAANQPARTHVGHCCGGLRRRLIREAVHRVAPFSRFRELLHAGPWLQRLLTSDLVAPLPGVPES
jgi:hypothetical protein